MVPGPGISQSIKQRAVRRPPGTSAYLPPDHSELILISNDRTHLHADDLTSNFLLVSETGNLNKT